MALAVGDANSAAEFVFPASEDVGAPSRDDGRIPGEAHDDAILIRDPDLSRPTRRRQSIVHRRPDTYKNLSSRPE